MNYPEYPPEERRRRLALVYKILLQAAARAQAERQAARPLLPAPQDPPSVLLEPVPSPTVASLATHSESEAIHARQEES